MDGKLKPLAGGAAKTAAVVPPLLQEVGKLAASVASVNTSSSGSATGNPRNKCALKPGHSLMDWIRLGSSGKDLTHVGPMAGKLQVSPKELAKHRTENDAWLAIRGRVYNVTDYLSFHPGGVEQMMQGVGRDCTDLFDNIHPWVNYDKILMKCYIGVLTNTTDEVIVPTEASTSADPPKKTFDDLSSALHNLGNQQQKPAQEVHQIAAQHKINFDWIQKADVLFLYFYLGAGMNPYVQIEPPDGKKITIHITSKKYTYTYCIDFLHQITWPVKYKINYETGKLEVVVNKEKKAVWTTFGTVSSTAAEVQQGKLPKIEGTVTHKKRLNYNCLFLEISRNDGIISNVPLGKHLKIYNDNDDSRSYSPIPCCLREEYVHEKYTTTPKWCFLVKRYPNGTLSTYITHKRVNDDIAMSHPIGTFDLTTVMQPVHFIMLAAGTGINPLLGIILALLDRRIKPVKTIDLLFFNRHEEDIILRDELMNFVAKEPRLSVEFILSQGSAYWGGKRGRVNQEMIKNTMNKSVPINQDRKQLHILACGSTGFGENVRKILEGMHFNMTNLYVFPG